MWHSYISTTQNNNKSITIVWWKYHNTCNTIILSAYLSYLPAYSPMNNDSSIQDFLTKIWLNDFERDIFLTLAKLWTQPASTIAKHLNVERTWVYKHMQSMAEQGRIATSRIKGVTQFYIPGPEILLQRIQARQAYRNELSEGYETFAQEFQLLSADRYPHLPSIRLYDGVQSIQTLYQDIYDTTIQNKYLLIKFFASNTFESQTSVQSRVKDIAKDIFEKLNKKKVTVETYLGNGVMIMEQITKTTNIQNISDLPAGNSAINFFIVWNILYLIVFKTVPFGIRIESDDLANAMHFLFDSLDVK